MKKFNFIISIFFLFFTNISAFAINENMEYMNLNWWKNFHDDYLTNNLLKVYENNYDLKNAALKIKQSEQAIKMQFANELPTVNFSGEISRDLQAARQQFGNMTIPTYSQNNFYLPLTAGYEVDIWAKNRLKTKSKNQQSEIIKQAVRSTYISLTSCFAVDYFSLIKTDKLIEIQQNLIDTQTVILDLTKEKYKIGLIPVTEVLNQELFLNILNEENNNYIKTREILINNLKVYLSDDEVQRNDFEQIVLIDNIPENYNSKIVENRPDYLREEANLKKIGFDVQIAKKEFLPNFTIFGQIGLNAYTLSTLCKSPSQFFSAGILPNIDLFAGGRKIAMLKMQKLKYEEALNSYQKTFLTGVSEINSGLADYKTANKNFEESNNKLSTQSKLFELAKEKRNIGSSNNLDVLFAKEVYLSAQKDFVSDKINSLLSVIGLYKATGGVDLYKINTENFNDDV